MLDQILRPFPAHVHGLTLVHDPDQILAEEEVRAALLERGFNLLTEADPVELRYQLAQFGAFSPEQPLIIITPEPLNGLPYDLWQSGHRVTLALNTFFPNLAYPLLKTLTPDQRWRLAQIRPPARALGRLGTADFILAHVFEVDWPTLTRPGGLIAWLNRYHHAELNPMPAALVDRWLEVLASTPALHGWPLIELLSDRVAFAAFMGEQWQGYVSQKLLQPLGEPKGAYLLDFERNEGLQDTLPQLVRHGVVQRVTVVAPARLPEWAQTGVQDEAEADDRRRVEELFVLMAEQATALQAARWSDWAILARTWAELTARRGWPGTTLAAADEERYGVWLGRLDEALASWLLGRYAPLGGQRLPDPHHVHHIPHFMAYERRKGRAGRVALLVLDGLSLAAWTAIERAWRLRQPDWHMAERLVLTQIPPITPISRQALFSGFRPADFAESLAHNQDEARLWAAFWARQDVPTNACAYTRLRLGPEGLPAEMQLGRVQVLGIVYNALDDLVHGATLGAAAVWAGIDVWLREQSPRLEIAVNRLIASGYTVYLASDHGFSEAAGIGQPAEGLTVQTRGRRARVYATKRAALAVQADFPETILWGDDGLLPADSWVLMPRNQSGRRRAFATLGEHVVTHGGLSLDELVVPLVRIGRQA